MDESTIEYFVLYDTKDEKFLIDNLELAIDDGGHRWWDSEISEHLVAVPFVNGRCDWFKMPIRSALKFISLQNNTNVILVRVINWAEYFKNKPFLDWDDIIPIGKIEFTKGPPDLLQ